MRRRSSMAVADVTGCAAKVMVPPSGAKRPRSKRRSVDFPQPLGPSSTVVRLAAMARSSGANASRPANDFRTPRRSNIESLRVNEDFAIDGFEFVRHVGAAGPDFQQFTQFTPRFAES